MRPRSWVVEQRGRRATRLGAAAFAAVLVLTGCGQAQYVAAPSPRFTTGVPPASTVPTPTPPPVIAEEPELDAVEPDEPTIDVGQMLIVDDAGNAITNSTAWAVFDERIGARLANNWSVSVAVMIDGEIVHTAAFGERVAGTGEPVEPTDRFRIASISKTLTAVTALRLVEQGALTLDGPVGPTIAEHLGLATYDTDAREVTVRELLSHTAGFPKGADMVFGAGAASCNEIASRAMESMVGGGGYNYSNVGYCVLSVLIEAVTGKAYERVVNEEVLEPLGIDGMRITSTYEIGPDEVSHHPVPGRNYMETLAGAGAWNATPSDIVRLLDAIDPKTDGLKALTPQSMAIMRYRVPVDAPPSGYGLGIVNYGGDAWGHTGTIENAHSMALVQPDGVTWAVTVSGNSPSESEALRGIVRSALAAAFPG
jgi:D-alanyl-D-alanine carboxypeptidase